MIEINKIYCENCLETMSRMPDGFIDLTVTSPPYDNLRTYNGYEFDFESIAKELYRVTKNGGVVVWVVGDATINGSETGTSFKQALYFKEIGFNLHDTMIFAANKPPLTHNRYEQTFEYMFIFCKGDIKTFNPLKVKTITNGTLKKYNYVCGSTSQNSSIRSGTNRSLRIGELKYRLNIWFYPVGSMAGSEVMQHPATFPEQLAADHIYSWSNEGDLVYDPFMGSGTTPKMAHLQKRIWIGSEISQEYVDLANKRIKPYLDQTVLF